MWNNYSEWISNWNWDKLKKGKIHNEIRHNHNHSSQYTNKIFIINDKQWHVLILINTQLVQELIKQKWIKTNKYK